MVDNGVPCIQEPKETFGVRLSQYVDPDEPAISVGEHRGWSWAGWGLTFATLRC